jgi:hypothetical protein
MQHLRESPETLNLKNLSSTCQVRRSERNSTKRTAKAPRYVRRNALQIKNAATWLPQHLAKTIPKGIISKIQFSSKENFRAWALPLVDA